MRKYLIVIILFLSTIVNAKGLKNGKYEFTLRGFEGVSAEKVMSYCDVVVIGDECTLVVKNKKVPKSLKDPMITKSPKIGDTLYKGKLMFHKNKFWFLGHSKSDINAEGVEPCGDLDVICIDLKRRILWSC